MIEFENIEIIHSEAVPPGHMLLVPRMSMDLCEEHAGSLLFQRDPWGPDKFADQVVEDERRKGLDFLADQLDDLCRAWGMDPDKAWRVPKIFEHDRQSTFQQWRIDEMVSMQIINPRADIIVGDVL